MTIGNDNKQISNELKIPLSTIQRRTKLILGSGIINVRMQPLSKGLE